MKTGVACCALLLGLLVSAAAPVAAQVDEDEIGAWYMYFWNLRLKDGESRWGFQGDGQWRNWDLGGDLEQLLLRGGVTYSGKNNKVLFTLGYASITSGEPGDGDDTSHENRIYQEMLLPQKLGKRYYLRHRFRYEQRWVENQDFRTRFRYGLFVDIPVNRTDLKKGAIYVALYNELFINGERDIGNGMEVELFDRNRLYGAIGYAITDRLRFQGGYMQQTTEDWTKDQVQFSFHQSF